MNICPLCAKIEKEDESGVYNELCKEHYREGESCIIEVSNDIEDSELSLLDAKPTGRYMYVTGLDIDCMYVGVKAFEELKGRAK